MIYKIIWTEKSQTDLIEIIDYLIIEWGNKSAANFKNKVSNELDTISKMPKIYQKSDYNKNLRRCVVVKQISLYYIVADEKQEIIVVRLIDNRKNPNETKSKLNQK